MENIKEIIDEGIKVKEKLYFLTSNIKKCVEMLLKTYSNTNKILICGNGGSAADAQHFAAEFEGRYKLERRPLPCLALTTNTSTITAVGNDYGFDKIFERQVEAYGNKGDVLIGMSTSGNSENIIKAIEKASILEMKTISLLGHDGGKMKGLADIDLIVPSYDTPRIQETHMLILHTIAELFEKEYFKNDRIQ